MKKLQIFENNDKPNGETFNNYGFGTESEIFDLNWAIEFGNYGLSINSKYGDEFDPQKPHNYNGNPNSGLYYTEEGKPSFAWYITDDNKKFIAKNLLDNKTVEITLGGYVDNAYKKLEIIDEWGI